jgi:hypothetical protein
VLAGEQVGPEVVQPVALWGEPEVEQAEPEVVWAEPEVLQRVALRAAPEAAEQKVRGEERSEPEVVQPVVVRLLALALPPA